MKEIRLSSDSVQTTESIGAALALALQAAFPKTPVFVALYGDLGAGKTAFVRGFVSVLSPKSRVKSPTYTIVNEYRLGEYPVFHFDLYRIEDPDSLSSIGFDEYLKTGVSIAEWCEHLGDCGPHDPVTVTITKCGENERNITLSLPDTMVARFTPPERSPLC